MADLPPQPPADGCPLCRPQRESLLWKNRELRIVRVADVDHPAFCRVIWRDHVREMSDLASHQRVALMDVVLQVEQTLRELMQPDKMNLASFGNVVPHLHWHVIPRWRDDAHFPNPTWGARTASPGTQHDIGSGRLRQALLDALGIPDLEMDAPTGRAFEHTDYIVGPDTDHPVVLHPGHTNPALDALLARRGTHCWAMITAWNPGGCVQDAARNALDQAELIADLVQAGYMPLAARNLPHDPLAVPQFEEDALLVPGLHGDMAVRLGRRFGQIAVLAGEANAPAHLLSCFGTA